MPTLEEGRRKVFISYSHKDRDWLERLQIYLRPLELAGLVELWDDMKIRPGVLWRDHIIEALDASAVLVLLISADFLASDFIAENELPPLLEAAEKDGVKILPLILRPSRFEKIESLHRFESINPPSKPLLKLDKDEQEKYLVKLSKAVLAAIEETPVKTIKAGMADHARIFNFPFPRNKYFIGRDDILNRLHSGFTGGKFVQALTGFGGVGKTQMAIEYAYRHRQDYRAVLWCNAHSRESLISDFAALAGLLDLPKKDTEDQAAVASAVRHWLESVGEWLLILNDADDLVMARDFIPAGEAGHVLITTRAQTTRPIAEPQPVEGLPPSEGALFLLRRLEKMKEEEPLDLAPEILQEQAKALSKALGGLPLTLDLAAAFIKTKSSTLEEYQAVYQNELKALLKLRSRLAEDYPSVTAVFSLAFTKMAEANPIAANLLNACAFLEANSIPEEIFSEGAREFGETLISIAENPLTLSDALEMAGRYSLLWRHPEARMVSLHPLVQAVLRDEMDSDTRRMWVGRVVRAVSEVFPTPEYSNWPLCNRLIPHAQSLASLIDEYGFHFPEAARLMSEAGTYLNQRAQYAEAEPLYERALAIYDKAFGAEHPDVARGLNNLALLYNNLSRWGEAESLYQRALIICEKALGTEHPDTAKSLTGLALVRREQGRYGEAEPLLARALAIRENAFGLEHPDVARSLNNLALIYDNQGRYEEARSLYEQALVISRRALGRDHPDVATNLNNLANLNKSQGKYEEAESLYEHALTIREKSLGPEHPDVTTSLNNLAGLYYYQGRYAEAEPLYQRALAIRERTLGPEHPDVAQSLNNLASLYDNQGKYAEAEPLYRRALAIREKSLGPGHPSVATSLNNLASLYDNQGKYAEAEPLYRRALVIYEQALGPDHPDVATSLNNLASLCYYQGEYAEAEPLYQRALAIYEQALGPKHPDVATSLNNLAGLYKGQGKYAEAEPLYRRALAIYEQALGQEHPSVATSLNNLAGLYHTQSNIAEATHFYDRAKAIIDRLTKREARQ